MKRTFNSVDGKVTFTITHSTTYLLNKPTVYDFITKTAAICELFVIKCNQRVLGFAWIDGDGSIVIPDDLKNRIIVRDYDDMIPIAESNGNLHCIDCHCINVDELEV